MKRSLAWAAALLALTPVGATAQDAPRTDPEVGSPSEAIYGIPLEESRRDAAPDLIPGSAIRTENGVGSSAEVPGQRSERGGEGRGARPERRRRVRADAAQASARLSGDPSTAATTALIALVIAIPIAGGVMVGRLVGRRARL